MVGHERDNGVIWVHHSPAIIGGKPRYDWVRSAKRLVLTPSGAEWLRQVVGWDYARHS